MIIQKLIFSWIVRSIVFRQRLQSCYPKSSESKCNTENVYGLEDVIIWILLQLFYWMSERGPFKLFTLHTTCLHLSTYSHHLYWNSYIFSYFNTFFMVGNELPLIVCYCLNWFWRRCKVLVFHNYFDSHSKYFTYFSVFHLQPVIVEPPVAAVTWSNHFLHDSHITVEDFWHTLLSFLSFLQFIEVCVCAAL